MDTESKDDRLAAATAARAEAYSRLGAVLAAKEPSVDAKAQLERHIHEYHAVLRSVGR